MWQLFEKSNGNVEAKLMVRHSGQKLKEVALPWSDGTLSARLWQSGDKVVVGVPELGLHCYGATQAEAVFRLFTSLLKYYRQLRAYNNRLGERGLSHLKLLSKWVESIEDRMKAPQLDSNVLTMSRGRKR